MNSLTTKKDIKKTLIATSLAVLIGVINLTPVLALTNSASPASSLGQKLTVKEEGLRTRANREIDRRVTLLSNLITRINLFKKLSATDKANFTTQIQAEITSLTNLKAKIAADTDMTTLLADVGSIVKAYRVYALFVPKIHLLAAADTILETANLLTTIANQLNTKIGQAKASGKDVTALQTALTDMQAKIADAKTQYQNIETLIVPLTPDGYPNNKTIMQTARGDIKTGAQDLRTAKSDGRTIVTGLKTVGVTPIATPSATLSPTP